MTWAHSLASFWDLVRPRAEILGDSSLPSIARAVMPAPDKTYRSACPAESCGEEILRNPAKFSYFTVFAQR